MTEQYVNLTQTILNGAILAGATSLTVLSAAGMPATGTFRLNIDNELFLVTARSGTTLTVVSGQEGTAQASHALGATVTVVLTAAGLKASSYVAIVNIAAGLQSSQAAVATPQRIGGLFFDGSAWPNLSSISTITLRALLETTNAANAAKFVLQLFAGTGAPATVVTLSTASTTPVAVSADVSSFFRPAFGAATYLALLGLNAASSIDQATCSGAWIEVQP